MRAYNEGLKWNRRRAGNGEAAGMKQIKSATLIGLGAMGAFFTPGLQKVLGDDFRVIADGQRKKRLERGVTINGEDYRLSIVEPGEHTGPADLVIIAVKGYALEEALGQVANQVGPDSILLPVLNGLSCARQTGAVYGMDKVLYASMWVASSMENGVAHFDTQRGLIRFGEAKNDVWSDRVKALADLFDRAGIRYSVEPDMLRCLWVKFMGNVSENLPCALLGVPYGAYRPGSEADAIRKALMAEVAAVAKAEAGVEITEADRAARDQVTYGQNPANRPSTLQDLERGKKTEVDLFAGAMVELGTKHGIPTPYSELMLHGIRVREEKNAGTIPGM